ncbi:DNA helicase/exodeoxyribonuclease V alpha subunit [Cricetibacter osteomyelitidis]|uniref:RecBCD enzyme subunit RecD n=1 Tax=Cricetibacter osteomyelitidis TaxID=1521931 RepID=A0A4R2SSB7_9PAST|nr:exodeoxyribonuclease V subunit alpha [Cricetibacter osteomyelitidis]TCP91246.1 DNA helicase/exodeoxyribonuclease V alpha subunit [Cricetibacter osteomyelitidis]
MLQILARLKDEQLISSGDFYFAKLIADKQQGENYSPTVQNLAILLAGLCNFSQQKGNSCLYLDDDCEKNLFDLKYTTAQHYLTEIRQTIDFLPIKQWQTALKGHIAFTENPRQQVTPLVFQFNALYFYRVWQDEFFVADYLKSAVKKSQNFTTLEMETVRDVLNQLFPAQSEQQVNWQKIAVAVALKQAFCLISGGPGTGKTTTVANVLAGLQWLQIKQHREPLNIKLVAPTGKAGARLKESILKAINKLDLPAEITLSIPTEASTIHRLLGVRPFDDSTVFHQDNPITADVLVVDEASMIDLSLMAKLLKALPPHCKLILLGDKDQLASVEAGAIIGELGQFIREMEQQGYSPALTDYLTAVTDMPLQAHNGKYAEIADYLCSLRHSYRFGSQSGIGYLAKAVNDGQSLQSWQLFEHYGDIRLCEQNSSQNHAQQLLPIIESAVTHYGEYLKRVQAVQTGRKPLEQTIHGIFTAFKKVRFLTALRNSDFGVERLNVFFAEVLRNRGLLSFKQLREWYAGKPIMVVENDPNVGLYNGDIGLFLVDEQGNGKVWFEQGDKQYKAFSPSRVPNHEPAFAMTVHKSQGSEFEQVFFILPNSFSPVLSKELVYTALTRAKQELTVFTQEKIWKSAVRNSIKRQSGLAKLLNQ